MTTFETLICAALILTSAFISASEVAIFSLSRFQLRSLRERFKGSWRMIRRLLSQPGGLLTTLLVTNELVNISLSTLITEAVNDSWIQAQADPQRSSFFGGVTFVRNAYLPQLPEWLFQLLIGTVITTPILLLLCEATPKVIAARANLMIALIAAKPLTVLHRLMIPARVALSRILRLVDWTLSRATHPTTFANNDSESPEGRRIKEEDFLSMVEQGHAEGAIQTEELELIRKVFELDDRRVADIATPLNQIKSLSAQATVTDALALMKNGTPFSRIPIYRPGMPTKMMGVLYTKDLLIARLDPALEKENVQTMMRKPFIVSPNLKLATLFRKFKQSQNHMAIVESSEGVASGIVTMTDVLEALFEDFLETDEDEVGTGPAPLRAPTPPSSFKGGGKSQ
jgi:putative hemolysin